MRAARIDGPIPPRGGVGLKPAHLGTILTDRPDLGFFEIHAENYMGAGGPPHHWLELIRRDWPLSIHGVGLSLAAPTAPDADHLARLTALIARYQPALVSEHLAWAGHGGAYFNDLLPAPYTEETLARICDHVDLVQTRLQRQILLENPSTYLAFAESAIPEAEFIAAIVRRTGCGLLLDVNNLAVSAVNHGFDPHAWLIALPLDRVAEIHLAGYADTRDSAGRPLRIDAHDRAVRDDVWALYAAMVAAIGPQPTLIEWDNDLPEFARLHDEARRAEAIMNGSLADAA